MERIVEQFHKIDTSTISDALDRNGLTGQCLGIRSFNPAWKITGRAFTVKYGPVDIVKGTVGDFIDDVPEGGVVILDNQGRVDCTVWGDILTSVAKRRGIAGTVIDGVCRDTNRSLELNYPIFSVGRYMRTGKDRVQVDGIGCHVNLATVRVRPNDIVVGDADGVVVIPQEFEEKVLATALEIEAAEEKIRSAVEKGMRLADARKEFKYHSLQTKV
ncbi:MAG TPA: diguanylate cyclase [Synergistaceae bacterium]|jgi:regulator of RNase E activity RraA|nr:diguanylate cyclase [Synergistaceae bacterium]